MFPHARTHRPDHTGSQHLAREVRDMSVRKLFLSSNHGTLLICDRFNSWYQAQPELFHLVRTSRASMAVRSSPRCKAEDSIHRMWKDPYTYSLPISHNRFGMVIVVGSFKLSYSKACIDYGAGNSSLLCNSLPCLHVFEPNTSTQFGSKMKSHLNHRSRHGLLGFRYHGTDDPGMTHRSGNYLRRYNMYCCTG